MKKIFFAAIALVAILGCGKTLDDLPKPPIYKKEDPSCPSQQKEAVSKLGFVLSDGVEKLLDVLLGKSDGIAQICTK